MPLNAESQFLPWAFQTKGKRKREAEVAEKAQKFWQFKNKSYLCTALKEVVLSDGKERW